ncbi:unnamed protein product [Orchesella dallaii]|uniref:Innexin n=1 Tax=Orchesella dallaii TaxID=48710 RepID=A0ABP1PTX8_9HEXA
MYNLLYRLKPYFKRQETVVDNSIFRIHSTFTTVLLITFSMIVTWSQFVGQPIKCFTGNSGVPVNVLNTYCWIMTTYLMPDGFNGPSSFVASPGVVNDRSDELAKKYYTYYQWVCFVLFFQAMFCYFPKWLWQVWEDGLMNKLVCGLNIGVCEKADKDKNKGILLDYLVRHRNRHNVYAFRFWFCEALCCANIFLQMYFMNWFFNGDFITYGLRVLSLSDLDQEDRYDHMVYVFPSVTKCLFRKFGPSGSIEQHDAMCILPLNIVNEKTYIFIWCWFVILGILTAFLVVYRAAFLLVPIMRPAVMYKSNKMVSKEAIELLSHQLSLGDWWVIYMLGCNIDPQIYKEVIAEYAEKIRNDESNIKQTNLSKSS